jgi:L-arabinose isomerase
MLPQPRIGILPLYIMLYDETIPQYRPQIDAFAQRVADKLTEAGLEVELAPVCRVRSEVEAAVASLEAAQVDVLATLHLAYSPSLESVDALCATKLPILMLDTTPSPTFGPDATMDDMILNHGIHGVQDLASMLHRRKRKYQVVAGHIGDEDFMAEVLDAVYAARDARTFTEALRSSRVLVFGDAFEGMGDFMADWGLMAEKTGIVAERVTMQELAKAMWRITEAEIAAEDAADRKRFTASKLPQQVLSATNHVGLAVRRLLQERDATAFSFNFQSFDRSVGVPTVPFLEASKAMARGIGYAGEGDALTAGLVGALLKAFGETTFTEMFCPDWESGTIFMSHMGECNLALAASKPRLVEKEYAFGDCDNPAVAVFPLRPGLGSLVNLVPYPDGEFAAIVHPAEVLPGKPAAAFGQVPHFWLAPGPSSVLQAAQMLGLDVPIRGNLRIFLEGYSGLGGTHHLALVMGVDPMAIAAVVEAAGLTANLIALGGE